MSTTQVVNWPGVRNLKFPVSGAGSDIPVGTLLMPGTTGGTNKGIAIPVTAASNLGAIGILSELHDYSVVGDALTATLTQFWPIPGIATGSSLLGAAVGSNSINLPTHWVDLIDTATLIQVDYSLASTVAVVSNSTTTVVVTSFEDNFDGGFIYANAGTGIGQLEFVQASASGNITIPATPTTGLDSTTKLTKVLPFFHEFPVWKINTATAGNQLDSTAAIGTGRAACVGQYLMKNGQVQRLDPKIHNNTGGYNSLTQFSLFAQLAMISTIWHPLS